MTEAKQNDPSVQATEDPSGCPETTEFKYSDQNTVRWSSLTKVLTRASSKFAPGPFDEEGDNLDALLEDFRVLVVGAGGLGCEILKNLALSGFTDIEVIDLDIIDLSNLNRQFLFRKKDVGKPKAQIAAEFVMKRVPGCVIKWHMTKIQNKSESFYSKFNVVIAGLDNIEARRWLNAMLCDLVKTDKETGEIDPDSLIPFIDGGTEGFSGQCRVFVPRMSSCFECSVGLITPQRGFALCTLAGNPRRPEHCIAWAKMILWPKLTIIDDKNVNKYEYMNKENIQLGDLDKDKIQKVIEKIPDNPKPVKLDTDDVIHMSWLFNRASEYGDKHNIKGVTFEFTMQVVKNIIPAIASTNALISAACVNEAFKIITWCSFGLNNWFQYAGKDGIYSRTMIYDKNKECLVCGTEPIHYKMDQDAKFVSLYHKLYHDDIMRLQKPAVSIADGGPLYMTSKALRSAYKENLDKSIKELFASDTILMISDKKVLGNKGARIKVEFVKGEKFIKPCSEG
eukprot:746756_1